MMERRALVTKLSSSKVDNGKARHDQTFFARKTKDVAKTKKNYFWPHLLLLCLKFKFLMTNYFKYIMRKRSKGGKNKVKGHNFTSVVVGIFYFIL